MKYLLVWTVLLIAISIFWRNNRHQKNSSAHNTHRGATVDMLPCRWCGVHIPQTEAVRGRLGNYCSVAHQHKAEDSA